MCRAIVITRAACCFVLIKSSGICFFNMLFVTNLSRHLYSSASAKGSRMEIFVFVCHCCPAGTKLKHHAEESAASSAKPSASAKITVSVSIERPIFCPPRMRAKLRTTWRRQSIRLLLLQKLSCPQHQALHAWQLSASSGRYPEDILPYCLCVLQCIKYIYPRNGGDGATTDWVILPCWIALRQRQNLIALSLAMRVFCPSAMQCMQGILLRNLEARAFMASTVAICMQCTCAGSKAKAAAKKK